MLDSEPQPNDEQEKSETDEDPTKTDRPQLGDISGDYEFENLDGSVTKKWKEIESFLENIGLQKGMQRQRQEEWRSNIWTDLERFEKLLDKYSIVLGNRGSDDKDHLYPDVTTHANSVMRVQQNAFTDDRLNDFSDKVFNLGRSLDEVSYEWVQIFLEDNPEVVNVLEEYERKTGKNLSNYTLSEAIPTNALSSLLRRENIDSAAALDELTLGAFSEFREKCESGGLLKKYFDELAISQKRKERFEVGKQLLDQMAKEEYQLFQEKKAKRK